MSARTLTIATLLMLASTATPAAPIASAHFSTDAAFIDHHAGIGVALPDDEAFVAQARSGNNATNGDYELGLHVAPDFTNAGPVAGGSTQWRWGADSADNDWVPFALARTGSTVTFAMGNYAGSWTDAAVAAVNALGVRVRSQRGPTTTSATRLRGLAVDATGLGTATDMTAINGAIDLLVITGLDGDFTLTGEAQLNWDTLYGAIPNGSRLGFQIKGLQAPVLQAGAVPAPPAATLALLGMLAALALHRRPAAAARARG